MSNRDPAGLYVFARFEAKPGCGRAVARALREVLEPSRNEAGCRRIHAFQSTGDDHEFYIHSEWRDEAAFAHHATLPHTVAFVDEVSALIAHPVRAIRTRRLDADGAGERQRL